jgi:two-component system sensor histidine kinase EvgS
VSIELPAFAAESPAVLQLFSRSPQIDTLPSLVLLPQQEQWLKQKKILRLGCSYPDNPPFDISTNPQEFEGISADYAGLISHFLSTQIEVKCYSSRQAVLQALQAGDVDFVTSATPWEIQQHKYLALSSRYGVELPVLISRLGENLSLGHYLTDKRLAVVQGFLPEPLLRERYPQAKLTVFPTWQAAVGAVSLNQADVYLGNLAPMRRNYLNNLQVAGFSNLGELPFSFGVRKDNPLLLALLNQVLAAIPGEEQVLIQQRWNVGRNSLELSQQPIDFTPQEQSWMKNHPLVRVVISETFAPLTFIDEDGHFRGISADLLELISLRTGLRFKINTVLTVDEGEQKVLEGEADMIGALTRSDARKGSLLFSRSWLTNAFVFVTRDTRSAPTIVDGHEW